MNAGQWRPLSRKDKERLFANSNRIAHRDSNSISNRPNHLAPPAQRLHTSKDSHKIPAAQFQQQNIPRNEVKDQRLSQTRTEEEEWMRAVEAKFTTIAGEDKKISYEEFKQALDIKEELFTKSYFRLFDMDGSGEIELDEFMTSLKQISQQSDIDKLRFLFKIFDANGDGVITPDELKVVLSACVSESSLRMSDEKMNQLVAALLTAADVDSDGTITFDELKIQFEKYPMLIENLTVSPSNWLKLHQKPKKTNPCKILQKKAINLIRNNKPLLALLIVHFLAFTGCFIGSAVKYRNSNGWVIVARGCGMSLNYHGAVLALSMARRTLTFLRNTRIGPYLCADDHIELHKMFGVTTVVLSIVHTVCHLANIGVVVAAGSAHAYWQILLTRASGIGWFFQTAYPTGVALTVIILTMGCFCLPIVRKTGKFELFYYTHLLFVPFWLLMVIHGPIFWIWFLLPGLLLIMERGYSVYVHFRQKTDKKGFYLVEANLLPSKVTHLVITRPPSFTFHAGDYVFLKIPSISNWEWHPFSISSAPEQDGILWLHIRSLGNWTKRLYNFYEKTEYLQSIEARDDEASEDSFRTKSARRRSQPDPLHSMPTTDKCFADRRKVYLDGPFGSAAVRMGDTNHAVLIAAGIGVTPFASVLQSLLTQHRRALRARSAAARTHGHDLKYSGPRYSDSDKLKKIDFIWVNRHANDFDWFITLLTQLEMEETRQNDFDHFLDLHLYMTAAKSSSDLKGVGLQMALELVHQDAKQDMITGLRTRTKAGRPNWKELFRNVKAENKGSVHIYFCGSPALANTIKDECDNFGFLFSHSF